MAHRFGFFDVDCREVDQSGRALSYRPRVWPIVSQLERLYTLAEAKGYPLVFTTCCSGRMPARQALPDTLFIPLDAGDMSWRGKLREYRRFYLAKPTCGNPQVNGACRAYDMFHHNANAACLAREPGVETWIVFGNGFDLCVGSAAAGILRAGCSLIVLEDVRISSTGTTLQSERATCLALKHRGAQLMTLEAFMHWADCA
jgi:hypothetical protein